MTLRNYVLAAGIALTPLTGCGQDNYVGSNAGYSCRLVNSFNWDSYKGGTIIAQKGEQKATFYEADTSESTLTFENMTLAESLDVITECREALRKNNQDKQT